MILMKVNSALGCSRQIIVLTPLHHHSQFSGCSNREFCFSLMSQWKMYLATIHRDLRKIWHNQSWRRIKVILKQVFTEYLHEVFVSISGRWMSCRVTMCCTKSWPDNISNFWCQRGPWGKLLATNMIAWWDNKRSLSQEDAVQLSAVNCAKWCRSLVPWNDFRSMGAKFDVFAINFIDFKGG